jgi:hypothetical protein
MEPDEIEKINEGLKGTYKIEFEETATALEATLNISLIFNSHVKLDYLKVVKHIQAFNKLIDKREFIDDKIIIKVKRGKISLQLKAKEDGFPFIIESLVYDKTNFNDFLEKLKSFKRFSLVGGVKIDTKPIMLPEDPLIFKKCIIGE